jgi:outer membrane immunogenic protein
MISAETKLMSSTALFAAAAAASAAPANAADLPTKAAPPIVAPTWQGLYVGASVGGSWLRTDIDPSAYNFGYNANGNTSHANRAGLLGGLQLGYNWQDRNFVYGLEVDYSWLGNNGATTNGSHAITTGYYSGYSAQTTSTTKINQLATFRARFGIDFNGTMPYLTAGLALGHIRNSFAANFAYSAEGTTRTHSASASRTSWQPGLVVGGGIEHQFSFDRHWSLRGEVLWVGFRDTTLNVPDGFGYGLTSPVRFSNQLVLGKVGLNYRF